MEAQNTLSTSTNLELWFDDFVSSLRSHQIQLETDTATKELKDFYKNLFSANPEQLFKQSKLQGQEFFVKRIIVDYIESLEKTPNKLAFDFNDSEVLVWAEIEEDEKFEKDLIMAEASINAKFYQYGFTMNSTIVESEDQLTIPNHYKIYQE